MRAAVCHAFGQPLVVEEVAIDPPGPGEVQVRMVACAICHSDILGIEGAWGGPLPAVFGHEAAGVVEALGDGVDHVAPGDHVVVSLIRSCGRCFFCVRGEPHICGDPRAQQDLGRLHALDGGAIRQGLRTAAFAETVVVDHSQVVPIARQIPLESAALLACGVITGLGAVTNTAGVPAGSSGGVIGAGGVGLNSIQGAALAGATPIVAIDPAPSKRAAARRFGATHVLDPGTADTERSIRDLTAGRGADYVLVTVGSADVMGRAVLLLRPGGTLVLVGMAPDGVEVAFEAVRLPDLGLRILGSKMGSTRPSVDLPRLIELYQQGRLKLDELITARYPLEEINQAIGDAKRGDALRNVIVF